MFSCTVSAMFEFMVVVCHCPMFFKLGALLDESASWGLRGFDMWNVAASMPRIVNV